MWGKRGAATAWAVAGTAGVARRGVFAGADLVVDLVVASPGLGVGVAAGVAGAAGAGCLRSCARLCAAAVVAALAVLGAAATSAGVAGMAETGPASAWAVSGAGAAAALLRVFLAGVAAVGRPSVFKRAARLVGAGGRGMVDHLSCKKTQPPSVNPAAVSIGWSLDPGRKARGRWPIMQRLGGAAACVRGCGVV